MTTTTKTQTQHTRQHGRSLWQRLRAAVAEMNYATRRLVELQAAPLAGVELSESLWQRLRGAVAEMNYATRRVVDRQAAPLAAGHPHR